ncbi:ABC transporter permease [Sphingosinicella soli]|uniref:ABC-2 type transport system permease protein n=1 Tax=Sphingosinicella soli TaxID=333708 RepID=A0A7W7F5C4_9SPHN|nr:ABC transporter permease [Sphingosinicella soli]MBB4631265.1 ABC-2 type transport system permease protein [Sphingosinicella soli]
MIRATLTIARRDIMATILSRGFLVWLAMPVIGLAFAVFASLVGGPRDAAPPPQAVAVVDPAGDFAPWVQAAAAREQTRNAYDRLRAAHGDTAAFARPAALLSDTQLDALAKRADVAAMAPRRAPAFVQVIIHGDPEEQARRLLTGKSRFGAALVVKPDGLMLLTRGKVQDAERIRTLAGLAWMRRTLAAEGLSDRMEAMRAAQPDITLAVLGDPAPQAQRRGAPILATGAATVLFALISLLAGALLSNMVEEKSNKIIEVLVAAVPVPAIYAGKLIAMLAVSLIGVTVWGLLFGGGLMLAAAQLPAGLIPMPPRGWPELLVLGVAYFTCAYLIYGAIYLGIGSLCSTIREVQTLSMPVTILQMVILISTLGALANPGGLWFQIVSWFPLSAPYMMLGRAAADTGLGIHLASIAWQLAFAALVIALAARLFRYGVLRSGSPPSLRQLAGLKPKAA